MQTAVSKRYSFVFLTCIAYLLLSQINEQLETSNTELKKISEELAVAQKGRDTAFQPTSGDAQEFSSLKARISELEGQLDETRQAQTSLRQDLEAKSTELSEANS